MNILVTGSSGVVGTALCLELMKKNEVYPLDIKSNMWSAEVDSRTIKLDLRKPINRKKLPEQIDMVVHLAANARVHELVLKPGLACDNYLMTFNVLELVRNLPVRNIIFSSSREVYGETHGSVTETDTHVSRIKSPYTASKFGAEALIHAYSQCYGVKSVIVRLSNVYGRYDVSERVIPLFFYYAMKNMPITVFGIKNLDFTYIDDCIDGLVRVIKKFKSVTGETINISSGTRESLMGVAGSIKDLVGSQSELIPGLKRTGEISGYLGDISSAKVNLGYAPKTDFRIGLIKNWEWYKEAVSIPHILHEQVKCLKRWKYIR